MENYITLSHINDFIFCPRSIYFHQLYATYHEQHYKQKVQIKGTAAHASIDNKTYTTSNTILQGTEVYSTKYNIVGKIDLFDIEKSKLIERKRSIVKIYDGYVFQVYAQYFALQEMGFTVKKIIIHDLIHNKNYPISLPEQDIAMLQKFEKTIQDITQYDMLQNDFVPNVDKCKQCIYSPLCDKSLC